MSVTEQSRISDAFAAAAGEGRAAFIAYLPAGYPTRERFLEEATRLLEYADLLEIGLPYSDPLGDGPTIQRASEQALRQGTTVAGTFAMAAELRARSAKPLLLMTYYNPILAWGEDRFVRAAREAGIDGLILPDLPPDEADTLRASAARAGVALTFLIAPTSTPARVKRVAEACTGFLYAVSVVGVTGARSGNALHEVPDLVALARQHTDRPVAVGFGVSDRESAARVAAVADGVVVGSVFINALEAGHALDPLLAEIREGTVRR
ncbi:tryptophan synthase alpha chain [Deinobacterium chartae]|uniref:Tryptophan synthase alpha chain n=1 Tax=Deinobacterium chartae TaxID=521158 RepID=A0A841HXT6_9DEIO|nr:tryptophan synthase subunit alpha [Deinobacterium chartae]MBB6096742.1 tryptophan synthase alpha chain [Deinobacterium chartae]